MAVSVKDFLDAVRGRYQDEPNKVEVAGSIAQEPFQGSDNKIEDFSKKMKGFAIVNDGENSLQFIINLKSVLNFPESNSDWEIGSLSSSNGQPQNTLNRVRTIDFIAVTSNTDYHLIYDDSSYDIIVMEYGVDGHDDFIKTSGWIEVPYTFTTTSNTTQLKVIIRKKDDSVFSDTQFINDIKFSFGQTHKNFGGFTVKKEESFTSAFNSFDKVIILGNTSYRGYVLGD